MQIEKEMIAPCGLDCKPCPINMLPFDKAASKDIINWYKQQGWLKKEEGWEEAIAREMYCKGCRSDRNDVHWSPDCFILECCFDKKHFDFFSECDKFPCVHLINWSKESVSHQEALETLKRKNKRHTIYNQRS